MVDSMVNHKKRKSDNNIKNNWEKKKNWNIKLNIINVLNNVDQTITD